jgi:hypothetical protein
MPPKDPSPRCPNCQALWKIYTQACDRHAKAKTTPEKAAAEQDMKEASKVYLAHRRNAHRRHI